MATNRWLGDAAAVARVVTLTVAGTPADTDTISYTIGNKVVTFTLGASDDEASAAAGLHALLNASAAAEFKEVSWSYVTGDAFVTGTAVTAGVPVYGTAGDTGTTTLTEVVTTESGGPNHADRAGNWSLGALPGAADDVLVDGGPDLLYFDDLSAAAYTTLRVKASFTGKIGLPFFNAGGYAEYRSRQWPVDTAVPVTIGEGEGAGPSRVNLSCGSALDATVIKTGNRQEQAVPVVNIHGNSSGTLAVVSGDVGIAADDDTKTGTVTTGTFGSGTLVVGKGGTVTTLNQKGGRVVNLGACPTVNTLGGTFDLYGTIATALTADPEKDTTLTVNWRAGGTIGTVTFRGQTGRRGPVLDCSGDPRVKTITNGTFTGGAILLDPDKTTVWSNAQTWDAASLSLSDIGSRLTLTRT